MKNIIIKKLIYFALIILCGDFKLYSLLCHVYLSIRLML